MSLVVVKPVTITEAKLIATDVPETDYAAYNAGTTYAAGARVISTSLHKVYESLQAANTGHPLLDPAWWAEVSATNRYKLFDDSVSTQTAQATSMAYTVRPGSACDAFALLNLTDCASVRLVIESDADGVVYDETHYVRGVPYSPDWWAWFFGDRAVPSLLVLRNLPAYADAEFSLTVEGGASLAVGVMIVGQQREIGDGVRYGASVGIRDYSRKETNDWGDTILRQRAWAKRASYSIWLPASHADGAFTYLASVRATACLWIGADGYDLTVVYGWYSAFDVLISYPTYTEASIEIEGLT